MEIVVIHRRSVSVLAHVPVRRPVCPNAASSGLCPCRVAAKSEFSLEKSVQFVPAEVGRLFPLGLKQAEIPPYGQDRQNASVFLVAADDQRADQRRVEFVRIVFDRSVEKVGFFDSP